MSRPLVSRLARVSAAELRWRAGSALRNSAQRVEATLRLPEWKRTDLTGVLGAGPDLEAARHAASTGNWREAHRLLAASIVKRPASFVIAPSMRASLRDRVAVAYPGAACDAAVRADRIVSGEYDLLGYRGLRFDTCDAASPDWHLDPVHGRRAPRQFWSTVPFLDPACGDHKIIWEFNRQQHLLVLGRAFWLTGDTRYRDEALSRMASWIDANPPLVGINWASMLELGFRALSWVWAVHLFAGDDRDDSEPWLVDVMLALDRQLSHIAHNLSHYFSPNTHLLGEALALYVAGQSLPVLASSAQYAARGRRILLQEIDQQIGRDGGHLERSTHYHRYTLDFYVLALAIAKITSDPAAAQFEAVVGRLAAAAQLLADRRGRLPHIGDDDGGMLLPLCGRAPDDIVDSLYAASVLVDRPELRIGDAPEEAFWLLAHPTLNAARENAGTPAASRVVGSATLPDMGYYISRSAAGDHLVLDAGAHGFKNGGHAHADALSMTLSVRDVPLLIDPGTGSYTANPEARERFRSSMLHNTLVVDGRSQSLPSGPFHWAHTATGRAHIWRANPGFDYLEASHDGYAPLEHRRHVLVLHGDLLIVADLLDGEGDHDVQVHWHLDPRWHVQVGAQRATLRTAGERVELAISRGTMEQVTGSSGEPVGWHSPVYGRIEQTSTLRVCTSGSAPLWVVSVFGMNPMNEVLTVDPIPVWAQAGAFGRMTAVRIARAHSVDLFGLATPGPRTDAAGAGSGGTWRLAGYETNARMLFCHAADGLSRLAMVDGSLVSSTDREALQVQLPEQVPDLHLDLARPHGRQPDAAHVSGVAFGTQVTFAGRRLPVAAERRATARASARAMEMARG